MPSSSYNGNSRTLRIWFSALAADLKAPHGLHLRVDQSSRHCILLHEPPDITITPITYVIPFRLPTTNEDAQRVIDLLQADIDRAAEEIINQTCLYRK